ncbi:MAG: WYL domain-containing protein [Campylobacteraceae bacterium]
MKNKKTFEVLTLLKELSTGKEVNVKQYSIEMEVSERTVRRYFEEIRMFFGEHTINQTNRGSYVAIIKKDIEKILPLNFEQKLEQDKLIGMLHVINPGFAAHLPQEYSQVNDKIRGELNKVFLIKCSPPEDFVDKDIFSKIARAIMFRNYCNILHDRILYNDVKPVKIVYCKGNWQLLVLITKKDKQEIKVLRLSFVQSILVKSKTFHTDEKVENFIINSQSFFDCYGVEPFEAIVAVSPKVIK